MGMCLNGSGRVSVEVRRASFIIRMQNGPHPEFSLVDLDDTILALCEAREYIRSKAQDRKPDLGVERHAAEQLAEGASAEQLEELVAQAARDHADDRCPPPRRGGLRAPWERFRTLLAALARRAQP